VDPEGDEKAILSGADALRVIHVRKDALRLSAHAVARRAASMGAVSMSHGMELMGRGGKSPRLDTIAGLAEPNDPGAEPGRARSTSPGPS
jgi:hypothetical protein